MATEFVILGAQGRNAGMDSALVLWNGSNQEYKLKANSTSGRLELSKQGFTVAGIGSEVPTDKAADYTVLAVDGGKFFVATAAANFTLPAIANVYDGWKVRFFNAADANMAVTAPAGKLIVFNNVAATSITFSTSGEKAGVGVEIIYDATLTKYLAVVSLPAETVTPTIA